MCRKTISSSSCSKLHCILLILLVQFHSLSVQYIHREINFENMGEKGRRDFGAEMGGWILRASVEN